MAFCITVKWRDPDKPVDSVLSFEISKGILSINFQGYGFYSGYVTFLIVQFFDLKTLFFAPHHIHPHKHLGPVTTFGTSGSSCNLKHGT